MKKGYGTVRVNDDDSMDVVIIVALDSNSKTDFSLMTLILYIS